MRDFQEREIKRDPLDLRKENDGLLAEEQRLTRLSINGVAMQVELYGPDKTFEKYCRNKDKQELKDTSPELQKLIKEYQLKWMK